MMLSEIHPLPLPLLSAHVATDSVYLSQHKGVHPPTGGHRVVSQLWCSADSDSMLSSSHEDTEWFRQCMTQSRVHAA